MNLFRARCNHRRAHLLIVAGVFALNACTIAPTYKKPEIAAPDNWNAPVDANAGDNWQPATPADHTARGVWWQRFNDDELNTLETQLQNGNFNLQIAVARYDTARTNANYADSGLFPTIGVDASVQRKRDSANKPPAASSAGTRPYSDALVRAQISYEIDLWGRLRNTARAADYRATAANADLVSAKLSLETELAQNYFHARALDTLIELLTNSSTSYARALELTENRYRGGIARASDVDQARVQLSSIQTQLADAQLQRQQAQNAIAVLIGVAPENYSLPVRALSAEAPNIPVGLPSQLLQRRPDIAGAERRVAAANADIGIARSAWFPTFTLNALGGYENNSTGNWLIAPNRLWAAGPAAALTLFDFGARRAQSDIAWANYREAVATYRQNVINGYREVEDNLAATRILNDERNSQHLAAEAAVRSQQQTEQRYRGGISLYLEVVTAQDKALTAQQSELNIRERQLTAAIQLIKALGGDWEAASSE